MGPKVQLRCIGNRVLNSQTAYAISSCGLTGEIGFPLHGQELLFEVVAFFAAGNDIALGGFPSPGNGYEMIHGEIFGRDCATAVMTNAFVTFSFPPLGAAHLSRLLAFPLDVVFRKIVCEWVHVISA